MLLTSTSSPSRSIVTRLWKAPAVCTSFAAARACRPRRLTISTWRSVMPLRPRRGGLPVAALHQVARAADALLTLGLEPPRELRDVGLLRLGLTAEAQDHRQVDAGQHLHLPRLEEGHGDVAGSAAVHVGEDEHSLPLIEPLEGR